MAPRRQRLHATLIVLWLPIAGYALTGALGNAHDALLLGLFVYALLASVSSIYGHLRMIAGERGGGSLVTVPCLPPLLYLLWILPSCLFRMDGVALAVQTATLWLLINVAVGGRSRNGS